MSICAPRYCVVTRGFGLGPQVLEVWRRFSDFAALHGKACRLLPQPGMALNPK
jgi:hypothetical protein